MLKIDRSCSQRIITTAIKHPSSSLLGLLDANGSDFQTYPDSASLLEALQRQPGAIVVHNQNDQALCSIASLQMLLPVNELW